MDWQTVEANWPAFVEAIETHWPEVDQVELLDIDGDRESFADYLAGVQDITRREAQDEIDRWLEGGIPTDVRMDAFRDNANIHEAGRHIPPGEDVYSDDGDFGDESEDNSDPDAPLGRD